MSSSIARGVVLALCVLGASLVDRMACAQERDEALPPRVSLLLEGEWAETLAQGVRADLAASLRRHEIELTPEQESAIAVVHIVAPSLDHAFATIRVEDDVTDKHVERVIALGRVPPDGWSLAIAAAADELLRASWAELRIADAPPPAIEPPPQIRAAVDRTMRPPDVIDGEWLLSLRGAVDGYLAGQVRVGGDLAVTWFLHERVGIELALGPRAAVPVTVERGRVTSWSLVGGLGLVASLVPRSGPVRLEGLLGVRGMAISWSGEPNERSLGQSVWSGALYARGEIRLAFVLDGGWRVLLGAGLGAPILTSSARDERGVLTGVSDLEVSGTLGIGVAP